MICFEVWINGERACVAGAEKMRSIHASLIYVNKIHGANGAVFMVGVDTESSESLKESASWLGRELNINDEINIKIVESGTPDKPETVKSFGTKIGPNGDAVRYCSFCGKSEADAGRLVAGFNANVCSDCTNLAADIFRDEA